ncbi:hypothetical protein KIL84_006998 [Mauremys mutica]|uniref:Uncharacterized protein n=1 Tax=Mauremys mutica TaxID=74926 RepID=A0A9D3X2K0_9SAUR|nr:hypothetical protein KIL84_006998 [Mauremys mutica]
MKSFPVRSNHSISPLYLQHLTSPLSKQNSSMFCQRTSVQSTYTTANWLFGDQGSYFKGVLFYAHFFAQVPGFFVLLLLLTLQQKLMPHCLSTRSLTLNSADQC